MTRPRAQRKRKPSLVPLPMLGIELGTRIIENPYDGERESVVVNLRESPLDRWRAHDDIDGAQLAAGERFRACWERAGIGGAKAFDWTREFVDGGKIHEPLTDTVRRAAKRLGEAALALGQRDYYLVTQVIGQRVFPSAMTSNRDEAEYISRRVRDALHELAKLWGMIAEGRR